MALIKFYKNSSSILDYTLDWSDFLTEGDSIVNSEWIPTLVGEINVDTDVFTASTTTVWLSGGVENTIYEVINHITTQLGREDYRVISVFVTNEPNELSPLVTQLRLHLGDTDSNSYRYIDDWLLIALESSIKALQRWWGEKYLIDETGDYIYRNPLEDDKFTQDSPPEIQHKDERPIVLMASILIKSGQLEKNSWTVGSWKDAEIAVSNIEGSRSKEFSIKLDWEELQSYLKSPQKQLFGAARNDPPEDSLWTN